MSIQDRILLNQMEIVELKRLYRNPLMWMFFGKSLKRDIDIRERRISAYENALLIMVPDFHFQEIERLKKFALGVK